MALTLDCFCAGMAGKTCTLDVAAVEYDVMYIETGHTLLWTLQILDSGGTPVSGVNWPNNGHYEADILSAALSDWGGLHPRFEVSQTAYQPAVLRPGASVSIAFRIRLEFVCGDLVTGRSSRKTVYAYSDGGGSDQITCDPGGHTIIMQATLGTGAAGGVLYASSPFCTFSFAAVTGGGFSPGPDDESNELTITGNPCLCAAGGTVPYTYYVVSGRLPSGQTLDPFSGCVTGTYDGRDPGTGTIKFGVHDADGSSAEVTCSTPPPCASATDFVGNAFY